MKTDRYVIVDSRTTCGNSVFFWCWDGAGYTCDLRVAAIFTEEEARRQERSRDTDKAYRLEDVLAIVQHHVDMQDLARVAKGDPPARAHTFSHLKVSR